MEADILFERLDQTEATLHDKALAAAIIRRAARAAARELDTDTPNRQAAHRPDPDIEPEL